MVQQVIKSHPIFHHIKIHTIILLQDTIGHDVDWMYWCMF